MDTGWQDLRELVERESCLETEYAGPTAPEPEDGKVLVLARGKVNDPVNTAPNPGDPPVAEILGE